MCNVCRQIPCHPRCPNASEPTPVHVCKKCGYGIYTGVKYFKSEDKYICEECIDEMSAEEILELCGESLQEA